MSGVIDLKKIIKKTRTVIMMIANDNITLYAAQASFFIIISTIPFIILLLSLAKYVIDIESVVALIESRMNSEIGNILKGLLGEVVS
ncbi:MAG: hypothetical protein IJ499_03825, partial [Clostridia bacterium]|nr:hypothetical protein [Clostridia bacterium]